jgi:membrane protease YdiL (CAAX protease family)
MIYDKVPWNLKAVLSIHILRLVVGLVLVRVLYPLIFVVTPFVVEVTDRVVVLALVWIMVRNCKGNFNNLGLSLQNLKSHIFYGVMIGVVLLGVSIFSERIYTTVLFLTPSQHPLVAEVDKAVSWRDLISPLFLAGILAPVTEEVLYRMFTFLPMKERWGFWGGAIASSIIFAIMHFNLYWLGEMIVVGVGLSFVYYWTGSLISAIVAHSIINTSKIIMLFLGIKFV